MNDALANRLAEKLFLCRKLRGKTLRDVESEAGVSSGYLSQLESGRIKQPGIFLVQRLAKYYGVTLADLVVE